MAVLLAGVFCWLQLAPVFDNATSAVPACCRKSGAHQCSMSRSDRADTKSIAATASSAHGPAFATLAAQCPYRYAGLTVSTETAGAVPIAAAIFAGLLSHPVQSAQTEAGYRISHQRSRHKRGPPSLSSSSILLS